MLISEYENIKGLTYLQYCDYLQNKYGIGGVINFIVPELNDVYSGWETNQNWRKTCHELIKEDKSVYLALLKRFKNNCRKYPLYTKTCLLTGFNQPFGLWSKAKNQKLYDEINAL